MSKKRTKAQIEADAKRTGRKPIPKSKRRNHVVGVRLTDAENKRVQAEAKRQGISPGELLAKPWRDKK